MRRTFGAAVGLRGGRVIVLRPLRHDDALRIQQACVDAETVRWLGGHAIHEEYGLSDALTFVDRANEATLMGTSLSLAVADAHTDILLGSVGLMGHHGRLDDTAGLGYWAHPDARSMGVTTAAANAMVNFAFAAVADGGMGLRRLHLTAAVGNVASQRVAEAAGFTLIGRTRQSGVLYDGTVTDEFVYDLLVSDQRARDLTPV